MTRTESETEPPANWLGRDLKSPAWIYFKGVLFLLIGILSSGLLLAEHPTFKVGVLLGLTVWGFCRSYYFAFYVIQHYIDSQYRFSGLWDFGMYLLKNSGSRKQDKI